MDRGPKKAIVLTGHGVLIEGGEASSLSLLFDRGRYQVEFNLSQSFSREELLALASEGQFIGTFTARLGDRVDLDHPQPALWSSGPIQALRGRQQFPTLSGDNATLSIKGRHLRVGAHIIVDGRRVAGNLRCQSGALPDCTVETVEIQLAALPVSTGMHLLRVQNPDGLFSNDFIFHTTTSGSGVASLDISGPWYNAGQDGHGWFLEQIPATDPAVLDLLNAYWYVYQDGLPIWLFGQGEMLDGIAELETFITSGAQFPPNFDPNTIRSISPLGAH